MMQSVQPKAVEGGKEVGREGGREGGEAGHALNAVGAWLRAGANINTTSPPFYAPVVVTPNFSAPWGWASISASRTGDEGEHACAIAAVTGAAYCLGGFYARRRGGLSSHRALRDTAMWFLVSPAGFPPHLSPRAQGTAPTASWGDP